MGSILYEFFGDVFSCNRDCNRRKTEFQYKSSGAVIPVDKTNYLHNTNCVSK